MPAPASRHFDYDGFLAECEQEMARLRWSNCFTARVIGIDDSSLWAARRKRTYAMTTAAALAVTLSVSLDKYLQEAA